MAGTGPTPRPAGPWTRRRVVRLLSWVSLGCAALLLLGTAGGVLLLRHYDGRITRIDGVVDAPTALALPLDVLLVGSDSREGLTGEEAFQGTGDEFITGQRSDVVILVHLYRGGRTAELVSLPRDSYVTIPAHTDPDTGRSVAASQGRLNGAFQQGGPALLVQTVEQLTGVSVEHYAQVDFTGFKAIVDEVGGVEVCLSEAQKEVRSGIDLPAGRQVVGGEQALAFVRQRAGLARGDLDRIGRQQELLGSLADRVLSAGTLLNPARLNGVLNAATSSLTVDEGLTGSRLRGLAAAVRDLEPGGVVFTTAPVADLSARRRGAAVVLLDDAAAAPLWQRLQQDVPPPPPPPPATPEVPDPADPCAV